MMNARRLLVVVMTSSVLGGTGVGVTSALSNYFYLHLWGLKSQSIGPLASGGLLASIIGIVAAPVISRKFGKKQAMVGLLLPGFRDTSFDAADALAVAICHALAPPLLAKVAS